jgi:5-methylcytosine-specific restriction endonuclease McrA
MNYADKLKDPRWQRKRLEVMERAGWKCQLCDEKDHELHVHHPRYIRGRELWEYDNLICLCSKCHDRHHGITARKPYTDPLWFIVQYDARHGNPDALALQLIIEHPNFPKETR